MPNDFVIPVADRDNAVRFPAAPAPPQGSAHQALLERPPEAALLGSLGIPTAGLLRDGEEHARIRSVAFSHSRVLVARATFHALGTDPDHPSLTKADARLDVLRLPSRQVMWSTTVRTRRHYVPPPFGTPPMPARELKKRYFWSRPAFLDLRWSGDDRCLSFTIHDDAARTPHRIVILDTIAWHEAATIADAQNGWVVALPEPRWGKPPW
jgi:hypothetical protein